MTSVYRYGLLPPTLGADVVDDQMRAGHRYQNALVELERARRDAVAWVLSNNAIDEIDLEIKALDEELSARRAAIQAERGATKRKRVPHTTATRDIARRRELRGTRRTLIAARRADPAVMAALAGIEERAKVLHKQFRADSGVYWCTYLKVEQAMDAARKGAKFGPPSFRRWNGGGAVSMQLQRRGPERLLMTADNAIECDDPRLHLDLIPTPVPNRRGKPLPRVRLRVGSDGARRPIWAEWPMIYHRPLPDGAVITWATVIRELVASSPRWALLLTIEHGGVAPTATRGAAVAVDLGWRRAIVDGDITTRACGHTATDDSDESELHVHRDVFGALGKADNLRSIRDKRMNEMQAILVAWLRGCGSEEHRERTRFVAQWRACARFAGLAIWWRDHRMEGDELIFVLLEAWRKRDKHLWLWEAHARRTARARRLDGYRVFAADLARRYETLIVEKINLAKVAEKPKPESTREHNATASSQRTATAPSELRGALVNAFRGRGGTVVEVGAHPSATAMLGEWRERPVAEEKPGVARMSKFGRLRAERGGSWAQRSRSPEPLEGGSASD